jgi:hypothetical protein
VVSDETRLVVGAVFVLVGATLAVFGLLGVATGERGGKAITAIGVAAIALGAVVLLTGDGGLA